jgi:hypothetical protein
MLRHKALQYWKGVTSIGDEKSVTSMSLATPDDRHLSYAKYFDSALVWIYGEGHC